LHIVTEPFFLNHQRLADVLPLPPDAAGPSNQAPPRTREDILLHEFMHVPFLAQDAIGQDILDNEINGRRAYGPDQAHALALSNSIDALSNADNYAVFAIAVWMRNMPTVTTFEDMPGEFSFWDFNTNIHEQIDPPIDFTRSWWAGNAWNLGSHP
jgi:hypothetical protein